MFPRPPISTLFPYTTLFRSNSLISNSNLISKVYFPRLIVPASSVIVSFVDFAISFGLLVLLMAWYHVWPSWHLLALPLFTRSEEHTSELQSLTNLVCRLLLE